MTALFTLQPEAVATVDADSKPAILDALAARFAAVYGLDRKTVLDAILERESLGSTGFGRGVAIPHARIESVNRPVAAFLRLQAPIDFNAADGAPIDFVFGLLSPEGAGAAHLHALAAISRLMRDDRMHRALVDAPGAEAIYGLLCNVIDRDAA
jgi:PTS system nitrogen regulatory IIA component